MAIQENQYQRLPGRGFVSDRLYLANDHLLRVNSNGMTEHYRRFYFTDIQAVVISLTDWQKVWTAIHLVICALFIIWLLAVENTAGRVVLGCISLFFGVNFLINALRGPTCQTQIQTRIGAESLPSLKRLRNARRVIDLLSLRIQDAQGDLNPEEIPQKLAGFGMRAGSFQRTAPARAASVPKTNSYRGGLHVWAFSVFLVEAAALAMNIFLPGILAALLMLVTLFAAAGLVIISLIKQSGSALSAALRTVTWAALAHVVLCLVGGYMLIVATIIDNPKIAGDQEALFIAMSEMHNPWVEGIYTFLAAFALIVALAGFITLLGSRVPAQPAVEVSSSL